MTIFKRFVSLGAALLLAALSLPVSYAADTAPLTDTKLLWLVNKEHTIDSTYCADDLVSVSSGVSMRADAADALSAMLADLNAAGHRIPTLLSGYRSYARQQTLFSSRLKQRTSAGMSKQAAYDDTALYTAPPGASEHQLGLAMDFSLDGTTSRSFGSTATGQWLEQNSWRYGYILRYTADKVDLTMIGAEPWHFRYVGVPHAQLMYENNWCFEEYMSVLAVEPLKLDNGDGTTYEVFRTTELPSADDTIQSVSSDNLGGYIVTALRPMDALAAVRGHWSETYFIQLLGEDASLYPHYVIDPGAPVTVSALKELCTLVKGETLFLPAQSGFFDLSDDAYLTREAVAVLLANAIDDNAVVYLHYSDIHKISGWAFQSIQKLTAQGVITGNDGAFRPGDRITWCECAAMLARFQELLLTEEQAEPVPEPEEPEPAPSPDSSMPAWLSVSSLLTTK